MNEDNSPQPQTEQLLKLLETQIAASRALRGSRPCGRSKTALIVAAFIVLGAIVALWMLMLMLEQMRPQRPGQPAGTGEHK